MLKAIIFDFDGVVVDSEPLHYRAFLRVASKLGGTRDLARRRTIEPRGVIVELIQVDLSGPAFADALPIGRR